MDLECAILSLGLPGVAEGVPWWDVERAADSESAALEHVRVNHRRLQVAVAEQILNGPYVVAALKQVGGEEWRKVWQETRLGMAASRAARATAFCRLLGLAWCRAKMPVRGS